MFGILKGLTKATVRIATAPVAMAADVITAGGVLTDRDKLYTEEVIERLEQDFEEMDDE